MSEIAAVAELKAHLSRFLRRVKAGEEIVITERNVPVARIVPVTAAADEGLRALERQGLVKLGSGKLPVYGRIIVGERLRWRGRKPARTSDSSRFCQFGR